MSEPVLLCRVNNPESGVLPRDLDDARICIWKARGVWWVYIPHCGAGSCPNHTVEEHPDGTVTFHGSILMQAHHKTTARHGYIEHNVWRDA